MRATIFANPVFSYTAEVRPLEAPSGTFNLRVCSWFSGASDPNERVVFQASLDRAGLLALRDLIDGELSSGR